MSMHVLPGGAVVRVRELRPGDQKALRAAFRELSPSSRYQRFLSPVADLSEELWRYLCSPDGRDHVAFVAFTSHDERVVGVVRFVRHSVDRAAGEMAVTVADAWQRQGLGSLLLGILVDAARRRGVRVFVAHALHSNIGVRRLMARHGVLDSRYQGGEHVLRLELGSRSAPASQSP